MASTVKEPSTAAERRAANARRSAPFISVVMPCLNEERTVGSCVRKANAALARLGMRGEVVVCDNGSTDGSVSAALKAGARIVACHAKGYGNALRYGVEHAHGNWIIMGDADDSYDFSSIEPFVSGLRGGADVVMGNRYRGGIQPGAMPWKNRFVGNPGLTLLLNALFHTHFGDSQCGLRAFTSHAFAAMRLGCGGMEFATEMLVSATKLRLTVVEVPTTLSPDGRGRPPHLSPWRDGWRIMKFLLASRLEPPRSSTAAIPAVGRSRAAKRGRAGPWLSVIMPTYNGTRFLATALNSVLAQECGELEVIAVDDGSTDNTVDILRAFARRLPMTIIERPHAGNWVANTNIGMRAARGRYLCWLHQDDCWLPNRMAALRRLSREHAQASLYVHPCWYMNADGRRLGQWGSPLPPGRALQPREVAEHLIVQNTIATCGAMFTAVAAVRAGPLDEQLWYSGDWDFWLRMARQGTTVYHPRPLAMFRLHADAQTMTCARRFRELQAQQAVVIDRHLASATAQRSVADVARFSADVNVALAILAGGGEANLPELLMRGILLGPTDWFRYARDSRVAERCLNRIQAGAMRWARPAPAADARGAAQHAAEMAPGEFTLQESEQWRLVGTNR